jgi:hypothetical protein
MNMTTDTLPTERTYLLDAFPTWAIGLLSISGRQRVWLTGTLYAWLEPRTGMVTLGSTSEREPHPALLR